MAGIPLVPRPDALLGYLLVGDVARQRLSRFLAGRSYSMLTEAARDLGIRQSALVTRINRLEEDLGQPFFERAERGRAMKLTRFGKRVAAAAQTIPAEEMPRG
ncbi:LysR family transcriptional regulator [Streptomyces sp. NPDC056835]|uniref:LysR family transcriptional regulator n=1 Tax=Streptomyces sp. NPDC056835 TaxID=3345956 RepID=UPI0036ADB0BD